MDNYIDLVKQFPLKLIKSEEQLDKAIKICNTLENKKDKNPDEEEYLEVLSLLISEYELIQFYRFLKRLYR
jgi:antitoxin component HigA of HigAB toxin-antitoxin module